MCKVNKYNLNDREYKFARAYVKTLNATKAAIEAGYEEKSAGTIGWRLLKKVDVNACVREMQENIAETMEESAEKIISEILAIARNSNTMDRDKVKAYELAANLLGHNQATKIEAKIDSKVSGNINLNIVVADKETGDGIDKLGEI